MDNTFESSEFAPIESGVILSPVAISYLLKAAKWAKFLSILGFIVAGFIALLAVFIGSIFTMIGRLSPMASMMPGALGTSVSVLYLVFAAIVFVLHLFLFQFATRTQKALTYQDNGLMDGGIHRLQSYFKMLGIIMIIYLVFMALAVIGTLALSTMMPHSM